MRTAPAILDTPRLRLRPPEPGDCQAIFENYAGDPEVTRYVWWPTHCSARDTEAFLAWSVEEWSRWSSGPYLICDRADGRILGGTGLTFEASDRVVTGYVLATIARFPNLDPDLVTDVCAYEHTLVRTH